MGSRVNRTFGILLATFLGASGLRANFTPAAWRREPLEALVGASTGNGWYFFPDGLNNPRILLKATGLLAASSPDRKLLTAGPPSWTSSAADPITLSKQGPFVPTIGGGGFLVAPHNGTLKMAIFDSSGAATIETIYSVSGSYTGISAELDSTGKLHVGFILNGNTIFYARRNNPGNWTIAGQTLPSLDIHETAVVPSTSTAVSLYYTATNISPTPYVRTLWEATPKVEADGKLYIMSGANPALRREDFVATILRGSRVAPLGRVYYFGDGLTSSWKLRRRTGASSTDLETAGNVIPRSIQVAFGPDGKQRVAWYNQTNKRVHYLKPGTANDIPALAGYPVTLSGTLANPDLLGLHFGPDGMPYLLYRTNDATGFVAYPNDNFDFNGNGRPEILDSAFNSTRAGLESLPVKPAAAGVANSANRLKLRFPTIGSALSNGVGGLQSTTENLLYRVELSPDLVTWTALSTGTAITYTPTASSGTLNTYVGVVAEPAPGTFPKRFARLAVTRLTYPY
jgi:hypothetical protein